MKIAVLGAGQLAAMMARAGHDLNIELCCLSPSIGDYTAANADVVKADYDDVEALDMLFTSTAVVTYEHEKVPVAPLEKYTAATNADSPLKPCLEALKISQDRLLEKRYLNNSDIQTAAFANISEPADLETATDITGLPAILKTRMGGYDGKGQVRIQSADELADAWATLGHSPCILEGMVSFSRELSIVSARNTSGQTIHYPLSENDHSDGILRVSQILLDDPLQSKAEAMMERLMTALDYIGVMTLELFDQDGTLIANEIAPRVHNSGHWSIEGANRSQFHNHLLAITDQPLEPIQTKPAAAMVNLIGSLPNLDSLEGLPNVAIHLYQKTARPGRKLGHITVTRDEEQSHSEFEAQLQKVVSLAAGS